MHLLEEVIFASRNDGKIREVEAILEGTGIRILSLHHYPEIPDIEEDGETFLDNAMKKARTVAELTGRATLADDSGLMVEALNGAPGIYSSRYSGSGATDAKNIAKLLHDMRDVSPGRRDASFVCVLVLYYRGGKYRTFEGRWKGQIAYEAAGDNGFGYDPVFFVPSIGLTVAQLSREVKNRISHRALALGKLKEALLQRNDLSVRA